MPMLIRRHLRLLILTMFLPALHCWQGWQAETALAHGVGYAQVMDANPVVLEFQYATGDPAAYAAIKVYAPHDPATAKDTPKAEYQNGRTDASGRFSFVPDTPGKWTVIMTDGQGHRSEAVIDYSPPLTESAKTSGQPGQPGQGARQSGLPPETAAPSPGVSSKSEISPAVAAMPTQNSFQSLPNAIKAVFGLSLFLNLLTLYYIIKSKLENKRRDHAHQ